LKDIPIIFPIALVVIIIATFFTGAYAIAEGAVRDGGSNPAQQHPAGTASDGDASVDHDWYQDAAILVCPLH
jgi:hypothetical protein